MAGEMTTVQTSESYSTDYDLSVEDSQDSTQSRETFCTEFAYGYSAVFLTIIVIVGFTANAIALAVYMKFAQKSTGAAALALILTVLAIVDMSFLCTRIFVRICPAIARYNGGPEGLVALIPYFYVWGWPVVTITYNSSQWITVVLTVHRYITVCLPHKVAKWCSMKRTAIYLVVTLLSVIIYSLPIFFDDNLVEKTRPDNSTYLSRTYTKLGADRTYQLWYKNILYQIIMYFIPNLVMLVLTVLLIRAVMRSKKMRNEMKAGTDKSLLASEAADDVTKMLVCVVILALVCNLASPLQRLLEYMNGGYSQCTTTFGLYMFEQVVGLAPNINCSANFFIFWWTSKEFRGTLKKLCSCTKSVENEKSKISSITSMTDTHGV